MIFVLFKSDQTAIDWKKRIASGECHMFGIRRLPRIQEQETQRGRKNGTDGFAWACFPTGSASWLAFE
ncbi:MAG: hypothetical protein BGN96_11515 [Bacteroidales bacterium 45-6]|nr:MAG: hypothetical protein BGN96_11515 [Bacteroidales bacterium 45-6]